MGTKKSTLRQGTEDGGQDPEAEEGSPGMKGLGALAWLRRYCRKPGQDERVCRARGRRLHRHLNPENPSSDAARPIDCRD